MRNQRYANVANPHIHALITGRYRFEDEAQAVKKMQYFEHHYTVSNKEKYDDMPKNKHCMQIWIKDYHISTQDADDGYLGHFAFVAPHMLSTGIYTLQATKIDIPLKYHPRRRRRKERLPNWAHPILRNVKKQKIYATLDEVMMEFDQLLMEYPDTTIPGDKKLLLMIFDRNSNAKQPVQKYVITIAPHKDGGFMLECKLNDYVGRVGPRATAKKDNAEEVPSGYFTSMISLKRKNRPASNTNAES